MPPDPFDRHLDEWDRVLELLEEWEAEAAARPPDPLWKMRETVEIALVDGEVLADDATD